MKLGQLIKDWRRMREVTIRDAAKIIGISYPTLCRFENGEEIEGTTLSKILAWAMSKR